MSRFFLPVLAGLAMCQTGCMLIPDVVHQPQVHNPFPQLSRVAVLPFYNLSDEPTVDGDRFAIAYYNELQSIPGFEVVPVGAAKRAMLDLKVNPSHPDDLRKLAAALSVDAVVVGAVTDYSPYYPPRLGLAVNWYAANPCFHRIPVGYGLPWGTAEEEYIPDSLVQAAEFELAREQLKTQTPRHPAPTTPRAGDVPRPADDVPRPADTEATTEEVPAPYDSAENGTEDAAGGSAASGPSLAVINGLIVPAASAPTDLPASWPDPRGFVPPPPSPECPTCRPYNGPIMTHVRTYNGNDGDFTTALANYYYFRDDGRSGSWQAYLQRSEDFIRFCCHQHITEMLVARGGAGETRVVLRWPIDRYER